MKKDPATDNLTKPDQIETAETVGSGGLQPPFSLSIS